MKIIFFINIIILWENLKINHILENSKYDIKFIDGVNQNLIYLKNPTLIVDNLNKLYINNFCKQINCDIEYIQGKNAIKFDKCLIISNENCDNSIENQSIYKLEEILYNSDNIEEIELDGSKYKYISNNKLGEGLLLKKNNKIYEDEKLIKNNLKNEFGLNENSEENINKND